MTLTRRAVIDVGTNSVKLLVADVAGREVTPVLEEGSQTRLGQGFYQTHRLQPEAIRHTAEAAGAFAAKARAHHARFLRVIATSAARDALNAQDLITALEVATAAQIEVISGDQEADLVFHGVTTDIRLANEPILLLDVGGGSTEFISGLGETKHFRQSFNLGAVRLLEQTPVSDPPTLAQLRACRDGVGEFLLAQVQPQLGATLRELAQAAGKTAPMLVGAGGTASVLGLMEVESDRFDRERLENTRLSAAQVTRQAERLWGLPLEARKRIVGLPPNRADVILTGVVIYEMVMARLGFEELRITTRGLRFGALIPPA